MMEAGRGWMRRHGALGRRAVAMLLAAGFVTGCNSGVTEQASSAVGGFFRGSTEEPTTLDDELLTPTIPCPAVTIRPGTESIRRMAAGAGAEALRWQASINRTARECAAEGEGENASLAVRVGVSGRVIEGSRGAPDTVELPLRVAVREAGDVTYSRLHTIRVERDGVSQSWAFVDENVRVSDENAEIFVGFDG